MESLSDTDSDGSFMNSQPASPISLSPNDSRQGEDDDFLQRRLRGGGGDLGFAVERRHPRIDDSTPDDAGDRGAGQSKTFDLSKYDVDEPFRYDAVVAAAFVPTFCLALGFVGESFLFFAGAGVGVARLLLDAGYETRAFGFAVITFFLMQFSLLFSALPLVWTSLSYFLLLVLFNSFAVLSASWIFLHFRVFRRFDVELTIVLEKILFAALPLVTLAIQSWTFVNFASTVAYLPYFLLVVGFFYAQLFLAIRPSSFWRKRLTAADDGGQDGSSSGDAILPPLVLPAEAVLIASALFAFVPAVSFLVVLPATEGVLDWSFYLRFCFLLSVGVFCASLFFAVNDVASYLTYLDLTPRQIRTVKLISGGNSLLCGYLWTVHALSSTSSGAWLPWLPLFACVHVGIGAAAAAQKMAADRRHALKLSLVAAGVFCFAYAAFFFQFPLLRRARGLVFHFGGVSVSIFAFVLLLFLLSVAGAFLVVQPLFVARRHLHPAVVCVVLVAHAALFHFAEMLLFLHDVYPFVGVLSSAALFASLYYRMYRVEFSSSSSSSSSPWSTTGVWIGLCLALSKVYFASLLHWDGGSVDGEESFLHFSLVFLVIAGVSGLALFADKMKTMWTRSRGATILDKRFLLPPALVLQFAAHFVFVRPLWTRLFELETMSFGDSLSIHMLLTGVIVKTLFPDEAPFALSSSRPSSTISLPSLYAFWFSLSATVFFLQPDLSLTGANLGLWIRLTGVSTTSHLFFLGDSTTTGGGLRPTPWILYSYGIGLPSAVEVMKFAGVHFGVNLRCLLYASTIVIAVGLALGHLWPHLFAASASSSTSAADVVDEDGDKTTDQQRRRSFHETVAPKMQLSLICLMMTASVVEWMTLPSASRRWNEVAIFRRGAPPFVYVVSILFPLLAIVSKLDRAEDPSSPRQRCSSFASRLRSGRISRLLIASFNASTLSNVLVFISFVVLTCCVAWKTLHPTTRHIFFLLTSLHFALLRADPLLFPPSNALGFKTERASFFVVAALFFYCAILQVAAICGSRFWRARAGVLESTLHLLEILLCVTLVPCATLTASQIGGDGLFPAHFLTSLPAASFSFATLPSAILLYVIATSGPAKVVAGLEFAFSVVLLSSHIVIE